MIESQNWTDGECVECGRESRVNDDELCLVCEDARDEQAQREQHAAIWQTVQEEFDGKVVVGVGCGTKQRYHVPDLDVEDVEPICRTRAGNGWDDKDCSVYRGHKDWCRRCIRILSVGGRDL